jgi:hypothetical protein
MSNQSPSANSRDQQGTAINNREQKPPVEDESGFTSGVDERADNVPARADIERTEDASKD